MPGQLYNEFQIQYNSWSVVFLPTTSLNEGPFPSDAIPKYD